MGLLIFIGIVFATLFFFWARSCVKELEEIRIQLRYYKKIENDLKTEQCKLEEAKEKQEKIFKTERKKFEEEKERHRERYKFYMEVIKEKTKGFPWAANIIAEYESREYSFEAWRLERKKRPAIQTAKVVRELKAKFKTEKFCREVAEGKLGYLLALFPWLEEYYDAPDDVIEQTIDTKDLDDSSSKEDRVRNYITQEQYKQLPPVERNQLALDRYNKQKKSNWQIGRDYEQYIGYLLEEQGYRVQFTGMTEKLHDMGRDLIAKKEDIIQIIQCKNWSKNKVIHEKHIFQLYGTFILYCMSEGLDPNSKKIWPVFYTTTKMSDMALKVANVLGVACVQEKKMGDFPQIKCNVSSNNGERIYHLPFDQQYEKTLVKRQKGGIYAKTCEEAESKGFRRAFKWQG